MPLYEYRCRECDELFELRRSVGEADDPAACPAGHVAGRRLLSVFAAAGRAVSAPAAPSGRPAGPCGGSCACVPS